MTSPQNQTLEVYFDLMSMNGGAHIFQIAQKFGILGALKEKPLNAADIANLCGTKERPTALLLDALCALEIVEKEGQGYSLAAVARFLIGDYKNLGDRYWDYLPQLLKTDVPLVAMDQRAESEQHYQTQAAALEWMMRPVAEAAAVALGIGKQRKNLSILDVGAGSAVWSLTFASHDAGTRVTAIDWPGVLKIALASAQRGGVSDRFSTLAGDYHQVELPANSYDLIIIGNVAHLETTEGNLSLFKKLYPSLKVGGEIAIFDIFPGLAKGDLPRTLYALGLALRTDRGTVYPPQELEDLLKKAGFKESRLTLLGVPPYTMGMLLARKPK